MKRDFKMRTKTYIQGFKNSQKIRVMFDGIGVYTTVSGVASVFATYTHSQAANDALLRLSYMRYMAQKNGDLVPTGVGMTSYNTTQVGTQVQIDLI
jgi:hypothetical protein